MNITAIEIKIGRVTICPYGDDSVWLTIDETSGEGMEVKLDDIEKLLIEYYEKNF